jgi:hypothetical protein
MHTLIVSMLPVGWQGRKNENAKIGEAIGQRQGLAIGGWGGAGE